MHIVLAAASVLIGSTVSKILAKFAVYQKGVSIFQESSISDIPHFTEELALLKTLDTLTFIFSVLLSLIIFLGLKFIFSLKTCNSFQKKVIGIGLLTPAIIYSIFVTFSGYSGINMLTSLSVIYIAVILFSFKIPPRPKTTDTSSVFTGIITGFFLMIVTRQIFPIPALFTSILALSPLFFYSFSSKFKFLSSPFIAILGFGIFFPFNLSVLILLLLVTVVVVGLGRKINNPTTIWLQKIPLLVVIFLALYNPLFYLGTFDSIEEGFWAGWVQRLLDGEVMYKNFAVHHPPLLLTGLYGFIKTFGESIFTIRLYFHLLQIAGLIIIFKVIKTSIKSGLLSIAIFILVLIFSSVQVKNNMEIRIGIGMLPILAAYFSVSAKPKLLGLTSGILAGLALMVSLETGIASLIASVTMFIFDHDATKNRLKKLGYFIVGLIGSLTPLTAYLFFTGSIGKFLEYISFYPSTFFRGFQNIPMNVPVFSPMVEWRNIHGFMDSPGFVWNLTQLFLISVFIVVLFRLFNHKHLKTSDLFIFGISVFGLITTRSALARSDLYHINYVWVISLILFGWAISQFGNKYKHLAVSFFLLIALLVKRDSLYSFIELQLTKLQSYGTPAGQYPMYEGPRAGISGWVDFDAKNYNGLIKYISDNTKPNEKIFAIPQSPEIYFLTDRDNATAFDVPVNFYTLHYQKEMVDQLKSSNLKFIIYNSKFSAGGMGVKDLQHLDSYVKENYKTIKSFEPYEVLVRND